MILATLPFALLFAAVHLGIGHLTLLDRTPRSRWLSASGGVAVAYVFLHVLPELAAHEVTFAEELSTGREMAERLVYLVAFAGLVVFYGLEQRLRRARRRGVDGVPDAGTFWLHIATFAGYNAIIGYLLLHREESGTVPLVIYGIAMSLHFVANDYGLRHDHQSRYDTRARWILAAAVLGGWAAGWGIDLSELGIGFLFAFVAGGVVLNVLKEELPDERESRLGAFLLGGVGYAALLLAI